MAIITYDKVMLIDRKYPSHLYAIHRYERSGKINLIARSETQAATLKMSLAETKDLITRLTFAVYEAENG